MDPLCAGEVTIGSNYLSNRDPDGFSTIIELFKPEFMLVPSFEEYLIASDLPKCVEFGDDEPSPRRPEGSPNLPLSAVLGVSKTLPEPPLGFVHACKL